MNNSSSQSKKAVIIGGCGHVGLPLGINFALVGIDTLLVDINQDSVDRVNSGDFPFVEEGGEEQLKKALDAGMRATTDERLCKDADIFVFVIGTPVDEHLNPKISDVFDIFKQYQQYFSNDSLVIMRSTLCPGTTEQLYHVLQEMDKDVGIAFCPERVAEGVALEETRSLPQIVSAFDDKSFQAAYDVFSLLAPAIIRLTPLEAELTKLMTNSWRYLEFAIANQFYMIAESNDIDFHRVYQAVTYEYPRAKGYKRPGFAAGPCLFKDTMQLASFYNHQFYLGHSAMLVNEGLASFVVQKAAKELGQSLQGKKVGILGMTFKADSDDIRESLSFRVKKALTFAGAKVQWHDPYLEDSMDLKEVLNTSDVVILCTPHSEYANLRFTKPFVDVWAYCKKPQVEIMPGYTDIKETKASK